MNEDGVKNRQQFQWKLSFGLWTGIAVFTGFVVSNHSLLPTSFHLAVGLTYAAIFTISLLCWYFPLHRGHSRDRERKHLYMDSHFGLPVSAAPATTTTEPTWIRPISLLLYNFQRFTLTTKLWFIGEVSFTALFLFASWLTICAVTG